MADQNTVQFQALSPQTMQLARSQTIATSLTLRTLQQAVITVSGGGPDFPAGQEPLQDNTAYVATNGTKYYRPDLAVAPRGAGMRPGPDVWFLKGDDDVISLQWTLELVPFGPDPGGATPLPLTIDSVRMEWSGGFHDFEAPGLEPVEGHAPDKPAFLVRGGAKLRPDEAAQLEAQMNHPESACRLTIGYSYSYTVQVPDESGQPSGPPDGPLHGRFGGMIGPGRLKVQPMASMRAMHVVPASEAVAADVTTEVAQPQAPMPGIAPAPTISRRLAPATRDWLISGRLTDIIRAHPTRPDARSQSVVRSVPFVFEPSDEQNGPIYRALHGAANLTAAWVHGEAGWLSASDFPNSVNRLPDQMRLAYNPEFAAPHLVPTLHRTTSGEPRVRLLARIAPYQDPRQIVLVRKLVDMPAGRVVIGEVQSSKLTMGGSFPEELVAVGDASASVPLTGLDLTLDLSLSYYQLFCQQIASAIGVPGVIDLVLPAPADGAPSGGDQPAPAPQNAHLDVALRLDRVDDLPCSISVPDDQLSPSTVTVTNLSGVDITIGGCSVTLLQVDADSVVPVDAYPGDCTTTFPIQLAAGAAVDLAIGPDTSPGTGGGDTTDVTGTLVWNGVLLELFDKRMVATPDAVLKRVHELAGPGDLTRDLTVSSPVFATGSLPAKWSQLFSVEVEVTGEDGHPTSVVLSLANPTKTLSAPITLDDIVSGAPGGITTVTYRVRNNYVDHQGQWTAPQEQSGTDLVVYPNNADGD